MPDSLPGGGRVWDALTPAPPASFVEGHAAGLGVRSAYATQAYRRAVSGALRSTVRLNERVRLCVERRGRESDCCRRWIAAASEQVGCSPMTGRGTLSAGLGDLVADAVQPRPPKGVNARRNCWHPFLTLVAKLWQVHHQSIYFNTEAKPFALDHLDIRCPRVELSCRGPLPRSERLLRCLEVIPYDVVLYRQEDYFLNDAVTVRSSRTATSQCSAPTGTPPRLRRHDTGTGLRECRVEAYMRPTSFRRARPTLIDHGPYESRSSSPSKPTVSIPMKGADEARVTRQSGFRVVRSR